MGLFRSKAEKHAEEKYAIACAVLNATINELLKSKEETRKLRAALKVRESEIAKLKESLENALVERDKKIARILDAIDE